MYTIALSLLKGVSLKVWGYLVAFVLAVMAIRAVFNRGKSSQQYNGIKNHLDAVKRANKAENELVKELTKEQYNKIKNKWKR